MRPIAECCVKRELYGYIWGCAACGIKQPTNEKKIKLKRMKERKPQL